MAAEERHTETEGRIRAAMAQLLGGDIPDGLKCDVKSLCALSGVPRATLYRSYPHIKAEFERERSDAHTWLCQVWVAPPEAGIAGLSGPTCRLTGQLLLGLSGPT